MDNRIELTIKCYEEMNENSNISIESPLKMTYNVRCGQELKENHLKKLRSLITSLSSEITEEIYEANIDKINIFDVFLMDFEENYEDFNMILQRELLKIAKLLGWKQSKIRINFQVKKLL